MTLVRRLVGKTSLNQLDAFSKIDQSFTQTTTTGGTVSLLSYILIVILVAFEVTYYTSSRVKFLYSVDNDFDSKLDINIDITVAMPCETVGADIMDTTNQNNAYTYGRLEEEPTYYELTPNQEAHWSSIRELNNYLRNEHHSLQEFLWKPDVRVQKKFDRDIPPRELAIPDKQPDACRLHGVLTVNKVSGNLHVTVGKHLPLPIGHAHISLFTTEKDYNFSHRIERFSFGQYVPSIINPLEGEEKIAKANTHLFQYYMKVLSTEINTSDLKLKTYQYTTTERDRVVDHDSGSHGMPGIYFKYELDAIQVKVIDEHTPIWRFLIRLCGIIGGIYATSGLMNTIANAVVGVVTCRYLGKLRNNDGMSHSQLDVSGYQTVENFAVPSDKVSLLYSSHHGVNGTNNENS